MQQDIADIRLFPTLLTNWMNFVCYIAGPLQVVFTPKKYMVYQPNPEKYPVYQPYKKKKEEEISADISKPKNPIAFFL